MINRILAAAVLLMVCSASLADHQAVYRLFCVTDNGNKQINYVAAFNPDEPMEVFGEWRGAQKILDPESGVEQWMRREYGPNWATHPLIVLSKVSGRCSQGS